MNACSEMPIFSSGSASTAKASPTPIVGVVGDSMRVILFRLRIKLAARMLAVSCRRCLLLK